MSVALRLTVTLSDDENERLQAEAVRQDSSLSRIVRLAIKEYLARVEAQAKARKG